MSNIALFDTFLRGAASGLLLLGAAIFQLHGAAQRVDWAISFLCFSLVPYVIVSSPSLAPGFSGTGVVLEMTAAVVPVAIYWAAIELFDDHPDFDPRQLALAGAVVVMAWLSIFQPAFGVVRGVCVIVLFAHVLWFIFRGDAGDLVERRRRFRRWFLAWLVGLGMVVTGIEITRLDQSLPEAVLLLQAAVVLLSVAAFLAWSVRIVPDFHAPVRKPPVAENRANPALDILARRAKAAMSEGMWREEGLSVARMAMRLDTQEHRLRKVINQRLGHRNFSSFVNTYRIENAKARLAQPDLVEKTVLSIAYDVGFSSLGPFNRAFRRQTGLTPTEYRKAHLRDPED